MRQFVSAALPNSKGLLEIAGKDFHYLRNVLRLQVGDMAPVSVPGGRLLQTTVCRVDDAAKKITLQVCAAREQDDSQESSAAAVASGPRTFMTLLQFIPKPQKMELIVRQATECGIANIVPVIGEYTQAGSEKALQKSDRFERIIREARQQSGSQVETKIFEPQKLERALELIEGGDFGQEQNSLQGQEAAAATFSSAPAAKIVLYERGEKTMPLSAALGLSADCGNKEKPGACVFAIGSEGGISPAEFELLLERGFKAVHFNTNILRCETAALYAAAAIQSALDN
ncbi:MAG: 16S rRNA (uracil(1498)-N(3))-methyltransferase [Treponema sp.]|nr:16S rRNA (uracil(1498)-N(3))-methyltransferase [Treponema sp.]